MNLRESSLYVSRTTLRRLWWIARARGMVADALADEILTEALLSKWPELVAAEKSMKQAQADFNKAIGSATEVQLD